MHRALGAAILTLMVLDLTSCGDGGGDVGPQPQVASVTVEPSELTLHPGGTQQLTAIPRDEAGNPLVGLSITWTTSDPSVATVSETGMVTAIGPGSAVITAASEGKSGSATVSVGSVPPAPVASVTVSPGELTLLVGAPQQLTAVARDEAGHPLIGRPITWTTSEPLVASISETGMVSGVGAGTATITATSEGKNGSAAVSVVASVTFASVATGGAHTCALTTSGAAYCWGRGERGQLGIPVPTIMCQTDGGPFPCSRVPVAVGGGLAFEQLAGGGAHTCGLTSDGSVYCWGNGSTSPILVETEARFVSIDAGGSHTCGLTSDGTAYCWGSNNHGQLGDGTTTFSSVPVAVTGGHTFQVIVAGGFGPIGFIGGHTCALTTRGEAYCWGDNFRGQLGIGVQDLTAHPVPAPVSGELTFAGLTAGLGQHTCGLTGTGAAHCWGENSFGALGNTTGHDSPVPVPVSGGIVFDQVIAGGFIGHTCGRTADGTAYCWGENERGQVGDGSTVDRLQPSPVAGGLSFTRLDAGFRHTCGHTTTGVLYCWGSGGAGQLGLNSTDQRDVPSKVFGQP
jgi:alpha-tubulin suppressor-like RCC1 family protein